MKPLGGCDVPASPRRSASPVLPMLPSGISFHRFVQLAATVLRCPSAFAAIHDQSGLSVQASLNIDDAQAARVAQIAQGELDVSHLHATVGLEAGATEEHHSGNQAETKSHHGNGIWHTVCVSEFEASVFGNSVRELDEELYYSGRRQA